MQSTPSSFDIDVAALRRKGKSSQTRCHELCDGVEHAKMSRLFNKKVAGTVGNQVPLSQADRDSVKGSHSNTRALFGVLCLSLLRLPPKTFHKCQGWGAGAHPQAQALFWFSFRRHMEFFLFLCCTDALQSKIQRRHFADKCFCFGSLCNRVIASSVTALCFFEFDVL